MSANFFHVGRIVGAGQKFSSLVQHDSIERLMPGRGVLSSKRARYGPKVSREFDACRHGAASHSLSHAARDRPARFYCADDDEERKKCSLV
jgi:hypothetical protein